MVERALNVLVNGVALATAAAISLTHPTTAHAQVRFEIAPAVGAYMPTGLMPPGLGDNAMCVDPAGGGPCPFAPEKQTGARAFGGRVTVWLGLRGAIESSLWYSPSDVASQYPTRRPIAGRIVVADLHLVLRLPQLAPTLSPVVFVGPAVLHRSSAAYAHVAGTTSVGGTVGIGLDVHAGRRLGFRASVADYFYNLEFANDSFPGTLVGHVRKLQQDYVVSLSITPFGQRPKQGAGPLAGHRLEFSPAVGAYSPTRTLPFYPWVGFLKCGGCSPPPPPQQNHATTVGGRFTAWLSKRGALEGTLWYSPSGVGPSSGNVILGSARLVGRLAAKAPTISLLLMGGPAMIHRFGEYYDDPASVQGKTSLGAVLAFGLDLNPVRWFGCRLSIEDYIYGVRFSAANQTYGDGSSEAKGQHDFVMSLSIRAFGQRGEGRE